jgi:hypothetical protein
MPRILLAVSNLGLLQRHCGPVRALGGLPIHLAAVSRRPRAIWFSTHLHWRSIVEEMGRRESRRDRRGASASSRYLLPYLEQDALRRQGWGYVRVAYFPSLRDPRWLVSGLVATSSPVAAIQDGTSNTVFFGEAPPAGGAPAAAPGATGTIADGTSNTLLIGESQPDADASRGGTRGRPGTYLPPAGGDRIQPPATTGGGAGITDGTSNTFLVGEVLPGASGTGTAGEVTGITDGTSNTMFFG